MESMPTGGLKSRRFRKRRNPHAELKRQMKETGVTYQSLADAYGWSWNHVWRVINGQRTSDPVLRAAQARVAAKRA